MARGSSKEYRFWWYEASDGYYAYDNLTGESRGMGDGVDMLFTPSGRPMSPGTAAFNRAMDRWFRSDQTTIGEAYFGVYGD